jgi:lysozyme family protein
LALLKLEPLLASIPPELVMLSQVLLSAYLAWWTSFAMSTTPGNPSFERALEFVLKSEGGYINHPHDRGGPTNKGILQRVYDKYRDDRQEDRRDVREISDEEVEDIYYNEYWVPGKCYKFPWPLFAVHFDGCVNTGVGQANKFLQRAVGTKADGAIGSKTIMAYEDKVKEVGVDAIVQNILEQRKGFYDLLVYQDPTQKSFINGWQNRLQDLKEYIA